MSSTLNHLKGQFPHHGRVEWIGVRPQKNSSIAPLKMVEACANYGLMGDHTSLTRGGKRQVTLFQAEYLPVVVSLHSDTSLSYEKFRRNIVVSGLNLNILVNEQLQIGEALIEITGLCHPCAKIERELGTGAYNALSGHGGITAKIIQSGQIRLGDSVKIVQCQTNLL